MVGNTHWSDEEIDTLKDLYYDHSNDEIAEVLDKRNVSAIQHKGPRLGLEKSETAIVERRAEEYSEPDLDTQYAAFISGLVSGEGSFIQKEETKFSFQIQMSDREEEMMKNVKNYFGVGSINFYDSRKEHWDDIVVYGVSDRSELLGVIIPFFDEVGLYDSYKSEQYLEWKGEFYRVLYQKT